MRITEKQLRQVIRRGLLTEEIFGAQAFVYHGSPTRPEKFQKIIDSNVFEPGRGGGAMYGRGLYTVYENDPDSNTFRGSYGQWVYKLKVNIRDFLIFDSDVCKKVWGEWVGILEQLKRLGLQGLANKIRKDFRPEKVQALEEEPASNITSNSALQLHNIVSPHVRGMIFTGVRDGKVAVVYDPAAVVLAGWKVADKDPKPGSPSASDWERFVISPESISRSVAGTFTPMRHNYPLGPSTESAAAIQYGLNEMNLAYDDHESEISEKNGGLDDLLVKNPKAWEKQVRWEMQNIVDRGIAEGQYSDRFYDDEINDLAAQAFDLVKDKMI